MARLAILVFLTVCTALSHQKAPCKRLYRYNGKIDHDVLFNDLAKKVAEIDNKLKSSCQGHSNAETKEIIERKRYAIRTPLSDYTEKDIEINVRQKVLHIKAKNEHKHYAELRILPSFVDVPNARYTLEGGVLEVAFPIKTGPNTCDSGFSDSVTAVPMFDKYTGTGPRFGEDNDIA